MIRQWLYDWQTLVAGALALLAGGVAAIAAYLAGRSQVDAVKEQTKVTYLAGQSQVDAVNQQTRAVEDQNAELKQQAQRALARQVIVAGRLIGGVLTRVEVGIATLEKLLQQPQYFSTQIPVVPLEYRKMILSTDLAVVWDTLGSCGVEVINNYLLLDMELAQVVSSRVPGYHIVKSEIQRLKLYIDTLRRELEREAQRCRSILAD